MYNINNYLTIFIKEELMFYIKKETLVTIVVFSLLIIVIFLSIDIIRKDYVKNKKLLDVCNRKEEQLDILEMVLMIPNL